MQYDEECLYFRGLGKSEVIHYAGLDTTINIGAFVCALLNKGQDEAYYQKLKRIAEEINYYAKEYNRTLGEQPSGSIIGINTKEAKQCVSKILNAITGFIDTQADTDIDYLLTELIFLFPCFNNCKELRKKHLPTSSDIVRSAATKEIYPETEELYSLLEEKEPDLRQRYPSEKELRAFVKEKYPNYFFQADKFMYLYFNDHHSREEERDWNMLCGYMEWINCLLYRTESLGTADTVINSLVGTYKEDYYKGKGYIGYIKTENAYVFNFMEEVERVRRMCELLRAAYHPYGDEDLRAALPIASETDITVSETDIKNIKDALRNIPDSVLANREPTRVTSEEASRIFSTPKNREVRVANVFSIVSLDELLCAEIIHIKSKGKEIRKCKYCGDFFVPYQTDSENCPKCSKRGARNKFQKKMIPERRIFERRKNSYSKWAKINYNIDDEILKQAILFVSCLDEKERNDSFFELLYYSEELRGDKERKALDDEIRKLKARIQKDIEDRRIKWEANASELVKKIESDREIDADATVTNEIPPLPPVADRSPLLCKVKKAAKWEH